MFRIVPIRAVLTSMVRRVMKAAAHRLPGAAPRAAVHCVLLCATVLLAGCGADSLCKVDPEAGWNGGFESVLEGYPANWAFFPDPEGDDTFDVRVETEGAIKGARALRVEAGGGTNGHQGFRSPRLNLRPGSTYRIAFYAKTRGCSLKVNRIVMDPAGKINRRGGTIARVEPGDGEWSHFSDNLTVEEGEGKLQLIFLVEGEGVVWCDDVRVLRR